MCIRDSRHTASYDTMIASYLTERTGEKYPEKFTITFDKVQELRYGENPHQSAAFYKEMCIRDRNEGYGIV